VIDHPEAFKKVVTVFGILSFLYGFLVSWIINNPPRSK
jgi:hypothetical protein